MRIQVKVIPGARKPGVEVLPDGHLKVRVTAPPEGGRANAAVIDALADYYHVRKSSIVIVRGRTRRTKLFEISSAALLVIGIALA